MRRFLAILVLVALVAPLAACSGAPGACGGPMLPNLPALTLRSPLELFYEPQTVPGSRLMAVPSGYSYVAPTYSAPTGACTPQMPVGYSYSTTKPTAEAPCR